MIILASHLANWIRATESTLDRGLLETSAAIVNTAAILIFTLTLIPFQQYAASYSPLLLRYVRSDWRIVVSYSAFLLLILVSLGLLFCPLTFATAVTASACVLLSFLLVGATSFWSADLLDPRRVLPRIEVAVERALSGAIRHYRRQPRVLTADELREIMRQVLNTNDNQHAEATLLSVPIAQLQPAMSSLRTLQQLSAVFLRAGQVELFDAAYQTQLRCLRTYLTLRSDFVSNTDHLMITTADVIRDYAVIVRQVGNTHQSRTIWRGGLVPIS